MKGRWEVLWPITTAAKLKQGIIWSYIDGDQDPIVSQLRAWLLTNDMDSQPPVYPAATDPRPVEIVPPMLQALSCDVWPALERVALERVCRNYLKFYNLSANMQIPAACEPEQERLRQFRRLSGNPKLTFRSDNSIYFFLLFFGTDRSETVWDGGSMTRPTVGTRVS